MKKILKCFRFILLFFLIFTINCLAVKDCRHVKNERIIEEIKSQLNSSFIEREYISEFGKKYIDYSDIIFMVNCDDINKATIAVPVLTISRGIVGEVIITVQIENASSLNDILDCLALNANSTYSFQLNNFIPRLFKLYTDPARYISTNCIVKLLQHFGETFGPSDRILYIVGANTFNYDFEHLKIIHEIHKESSLTQSKFAFTPSSKKNSIIKLPCFDVTPCRKCKVK